MVMTGCIDKLAWKYFDVHSLKSMWRGAKQKFGGGDGYKDFEQKPDKERFIPTLRKNAPSTSFQGGFKQAAADNVPESWLGRIVPPTLAGAALGGLTGLALKRYVPGAAAFRGTIPIATVVGGSTGAVLGGFLDGNAKQEDAEEYAATHADPLQATVLGSGLGALTGAGLGYALGESKALVPGAFMGAALGGYAGYQHPSWFAKDPLVF